MHPESKTGAVLIDAACSPVIRSDFFVFARLVLDLCLLDLNETLENTRYMYDLNFCKGLFLSIRGARSLSHLKHRFHVMIFMISLIFKQKIKTMNQYMGLLYESPQR